MWLTAEQLLLEQQVLSHFNFPSQYKSFLPLLSAHAKLGMSQGQYSSALASVVKHIVSCHDKAQHPDVFGYGQLESFRPEQRSPLNFSFFSGSTFYLSVSVAKTS